MRRYQGPADGADLELARAPMPDIFSNWTSSYELCGNNTRPPTAGTTPAPTTPVSPSNSAGSRGGGKLAAIATGSVIVTASVAFLVYRFRCSAQKKAPQHPVFVNSLGSGGIDMTPLHGGAYIENSTYEDADADHSNI